MQLHREWFLGAKGEISNLSVVKCLLWRAKKGKANKQGGIANWRETGRGEEGGGAGMFKELWWSLGWHMGNPYSKAVERVMPPGLRPCRVCQILRGVVTLSLAGCAGAVLGCRRPAF